MMKYKDVNNWTSGNPSEVYPPYLLTELMKLQQGMLTLTESTTNLKESLDGTMWSKRLKGEDGSG